MSIEKRIIETVENSIANHMNAFKNQLDLLVKTNNELEAYSNNINLKSYTLGEASNLCGIKKGTLLNLAKNQDIEAIYIGNKYMVSHKTLSRLINGLRA
ncbi:MAG: helix-turn-helix domain-containing protein [Bacteroidetes bacterium]|nr:helix-turn-helix domain-containing protein [Bacteroidota bacterium]MCF8297831.1 hypothetical protein [Saprospiraceae bacterium]